MTTTTTSPYIPMQQLQGPSAHLPTSALTGQLLVTTDTNQLYVGTGTGLVKLTGGDTSHKTTYSLFNDNAAAYADGMPGTYDPRGADGWYYANAVIGEKINWYYYDPSVFSSTVAQFKSTYAVITPQTTGIPFFVVYTLGNANGWFQSRRIYSNASTTAIAGTKYLIHTGDDPGVYPELPRMKMNVTSTTDAFADTETIMTVTLHTNSTPPSANYYQFVTHQLGFKTTSLLREFNLRIKSDATLTVPILTASNKWSVTHNMGKRPSVTIVDETGNIMFADVNYINNNKIEVNFNKPVKGSVYFN